MRRLPPAPLHLTHRLSPTTSALIISLPSRESGGPDPPPLCHRVGTPSIPFPGVHTWPAGLRRYASGPLAHVVASGECLPPPWLPPPGLTRVRSPLR